MFRIRYKPTGGFVQKPAAMWYAATIINSCLVEKNCSSEELGWAITTRGLGHSYNTRKGAEKFLRMINRDIRDDFEIVEYKPSIEIVSVT